jgi:hypothetical protein
LRFARKRRDGEHLPQHRAPLLVARHVAFDPLIDVFARMPVMFVDMFVSKPLFHHCSPIAAREPLLNMGSNAWRGVL